jgi:hypothetical protein
VFKSHFDWCDTILKKEHGFTIKEAVWSESDKGEILLKKRKNIYIYAFADAKVFAQCA